jgi:microcin C transport system substrate-binding protein
VAASVALAALPLLAPAAPALAQMGEIKGAHGLALHGAPKYGPDFRHLDYVNPDAPKGGEIKLAAFGGFDSLNGFILRGTPAAGIGVIYDTLTTSSSDEAFTEYGLLAETIDVPADRSSVTYRLRPEARWHDGRPITVDDVTWTFETLKRDGHPFYRSYYANVDRAERVDDRTVRFVFEASGNAELPMIMGQMPVLPKHAWAGKDFTSTSLDAPLGSGPYKVAAIEPNRSITYERVADWWGKDLPINRGRFNFGRIRYDYYRDQSVMLEAFKAGAFDFRVESTAKDWATAYDVPAVREGRIVREEIRTEDPRGMQAFVLNTRRPAFQDLRVRMALNHLFDFEWLNKNIFYDQYKRTRSYFSNSELASSGLPGPDELKLLEPHRAKLPKEVFEKEFAPPANDTPNATRANLRAALDLFRQAGWELRNQRLVNQRGEPFTFEVLLDQPNFERVVQPWLRNLERAGIQASLRVVDSSQFQQRTDGFDFDVIVHTFPQSLSPGNEQRDFWHSSMAEVKGSQNLIGIRDPVVDDLIDKVIHAPDRQGLIAATRALDRVLLWSWYVVPQWHDDRYKVAYWNRFAHPERAPRYGLPFVATWWVDPAKDVGLNRAPQ